MLPVFYADAQFGKLFMEDEELYQGYLYTLSGRVEVTVKKYRSKRTLKQSAYYWGVVIRMIAEETGQSPQEIHEMMKLMFLKDIIKINGKEFETVKSSAGLNTEEFSKDYIERIKKWAFDFLNLIIPEANNVQ